MPLLLNYCYVLGNYSEIVWLNRVFILAFICIEMLLVMLLRLFSICDEVEQNDVKKIIAENTIKIDLRIEDIEDANIG
jgi:hypothetical protein